ncbi:MAG TPA: hypothetical protein VFM06_01600 [Candidatus Limnocylindria bacterium]|nr:hypothetical protein [Candidatus Limnocylindria bacterium]
MTDTGWALHYAGYDGSALRIDRATGRVIGPWIPRDPDPRLDFHLPAELCRCCAQELLPSGSRWSVWFCRECHTRVRAAGERDRAYRIPIGRHSIMNGHFLRDPFDDEAIDEFVDGFRVIAAAMDRTEEWTRERIRRNCAALGLPAHINVALGEYLRRVAAAGLSREGAFREMLDWWATVVP